jgi:hypothetical protein
MSLLGIIASQNYPRITNSYESIATVSVGSGGSANVEFTSIPSTFKHLQIRAIGKVVNTTAFAKDVLLQFNSDTGNNYSRHQLAGDGSATSAGAGTSTNHIIIGSFPDNNFGSSFFSSFVCDILDYTDTNKYTVIRSIGGYEVNSGTYNGTKFASGLWLNTNAVSSIKIYIDDRNLDQYSHFALYGIEGE